MFSNIYLKNHEAKFLEEIKQKKKKEEAAKKKEAGGDEKHFFFYLALRLDRATGVRREAGSK